MKNLTSNSLRFIPATISLVVALLANHAGAAILYWNNNGTGTPTSGTWNTTTAQWSTTTATTASPVVWNTGDAAAFYAGSSSTAVTITVNTANLAFAGFQDWFASGTVPVTISGTGSLSLNSGAQGFNVGGGPMTINIPINGSGQVAYESGTYTLTAANGYTGGTQLGYTYQSAGYGLMGVVYFSSGSAFGTGGIVVSNSAGGALVTGATTAITVPNNFTWGATNLPAQILNIVGNASGGVTWSGNWNLGSLPLILENGNNVINSNIISGPISGSANFFIADPGTLFLNGNNSFTGPMFLTNISGLSGPPTVVIGGSGQLGGGTYSGTIMNNGGGTLVYASSTSQTWSGAIWGGTSTFNVNGPGTLTLGGGADNNSLGVNVNGGTLILNKTSTSGVHALGGATTVNNGGTLQLGTSGGGGYEIYSGVNVTVNSGGVFDMNSQSLTLAGITSLSLSGTGISSGGALINSTTSATSTLTCSSGITLAANSSIGGAGNITLPSIISGSSKSLTKVGAGTVILSGNNSYSGGTTVTGGTLQMNTGGTLGSTSGTLLVNGGTLNLNSVNQTVGAVTISSGTIQGGTLTGSSYALQGGTVSANLGAGTVTVTSGTTTLSGTEAGTTVNINSGTLTLGNASVLSSSATVNLAGGALNMNGHNNTVNALQSSGSVLAKGTWGGTGTTGVNHISTSISSSSGILTVTTGGSTTTSVTSGGASTYGGSVTFTATVTGSSGDGSTPSGTVTFYDGGTQIGTGSLSGSGLSPTATFSTSTLSAAASPHSITASYGGNASYDVSTSSTYSQVVNARAVTLAGNPNKIYDGTTGIAGVDLKVTNPVGSDVVTVTGTGSSGDLAGSGFGVQAINNFTGLSLGGAQAANYTLTGASGSVTITAGDTGCNDAIANGNNGGTGFMAWANVSDASPSGTYNNGSSPAGDLCANGAWGLYTGTGAGPASAQRPFANSASLQVGQSIRVDMQNSASLQSGGSEGLSLYNASGTTVWELYFSGGATYWTIHDNSGTPASTIPYASSGMRAIFTLVTATTYSLTVQNPIGGTTYGPFTGTLISGTPPISQLRLYTYNIGGGNNLQFNDLAVGCPAFTITTQPSSTAACAGSTASFTAASTTASSPTYQWQVSTDSGSTWNSVSTGTGGTTGAYTTAATTSGMNGYEYRCVVTDGCSIAATSTVATLTVNAIPSTPTASNNGPVCTGATLSLSTPTVSGATYSWTGPNSFTSSAQNPTVSASATTAMAGTYNVTVTVSGCTSAAGSTTVTVNSTPATPGTITQANPSGSSVCSGASGVTYTISAVSGATTYTWTVPTGASITAGSGTTSITVNWGTATSGSVQVTAGNTCGTSAAASLAVTVNSTPATPGTITQANPSGSSVCTNAIGVTYSISAVSGATTYTWTVPTGASITAGSGTTSITVNWGTATSGNVTVTAGNTCGTSSASTLGVTVDPGPTGPTVSIAPSSTICAGSPATFSVSTSSGSPSGYAWRKRDTTAGWGNNWVFTYNSGGCDSYNGVFIGSATASGQSPGINNSGQAFGLYANTYNSAEAKRNFGSLSIGQNISFDMQIPVTLTGNDGSGHNSQALLALRNSANEANPRLEIWVLAGASYVTISDGTGDESATVPYDSNGYHCVFKLTGQNTYNLTVTRLSNSNVYTYTGRSLKGTSNDPVNQVRAWLKNYDSAGGSAEDFYINNLVAGAYEDNASNYTAGGCASTTWTTTPNLGFGPVSSSASYVISSPATTDSGSYDVLVWDSCGQAFASPVTLTVNAVPSTPTASNNGPVCTGTTLSLSTPTVTDATYSWTGPNSFASSAQNPTVSTSATTTMAGAYDVTVTVNGCASAAGSTTVTVNSTPAAPTAGNDNPVYGSTLHLTASAVSGAAYAWTGPNGFSSSAQNPTIANVTMAVSGEYNVTATVNSCTSSAGTTTVTVNQASTANSLTASPNPSLPGSNVTFTATLAAVPPGAGTPTGTVLFKTNGVPVGDPAALDDSGVAAFITNSLPHGSHTVFAEYAGDSNFVGSTNSVVQVVNTPPSAPNTSAEITENATLVYNSAKLLSLAHDPDGDTLSITSAGPVSTNGGTVTLTTTNITYQPVTNFVGMDLFSFVISDPYGASRTGTVLVAVSAANITSPNIVVPPAYDSGSGTFSVTFAGIPGYTYTVQTATSPTGPWSFLKSATAGADGLFVVTDTQDPPPPARYYRTVYP